MYPNMFVVIQRNGVVLGIDMQQIYIGILARPIYTIPAKLGEPQRIDNDGRRKEEPHISAKKP